MSCARIAARRVLFAVISAAVAHPAFAHAQTQSEETIDITAPAPGTIDAPVYTAPEPFAATDPGDEDLAEDEDLVTVSRPAAAVEAARRAVDALWRRHLGIGLTVGCGSPIGLFGVFAEADFHPAFGLTFGGGAGGTFGPSIAVGAVTRPFRAGPFAPVLGLSYSTNFTPAQYRSDPSLAAPANSHWLNIELGGELRLARGIALRLGVGWAIMLNTGEFTNQQVGPQYGPLSNVAVGWDPVSAADAHDEGHALGFPFVHLDASYFFPF
jgi:hypothetical protein